MTYTIHQFDDQRGWHLTKFSSSLSDFQSMDDQWAFDHILKNGNEYIKMGDTMWAIDYSVNNFQKTQK